MNDDDHPGIHDLVDALRGVQASFQLDALSATVALDHGPMTLRLNGRDHPLLTIEDANGVVVTVPYLGDAS